MGILRKLETTAATIPRSVAGSSSDIPPTRLTKMSSPDIINPTRFSSIATSRATRLISIPCVVRRPVPYFEELTSAWISTSIGRVPSIAASTAEPETPSGRSLRNNSEGLGTPTKPCPVISKIPSSFAAPNRFFAARKIR